MHPYQENVYHYEENVYRYQEYSFVKNEHVVFKEMPETIKCTFLENKDDESEWICVFVYYFLSSF